MASQGVENPRDNLKSRRQFMRYGAALIGAAALTVTNAGRIAWAEQPKPYFPVDSNWGVVGEIIKRAPKNLVMDPTIGNGTIVSFFDNGALLSDGLTNPGVTKGFKLYVPKGEFAPEVAPFRFPIDFPETSETVELFVSLLSQNSMNLAQRYNPGETPWLRREEILEVGGVDFLKDLNITAIYGVNGEVRKWFLKNGNKSDEFRPQLHKSYRSNA